MAKSAPTEKSLLREVERFARVAMDSRMTVESTTAGGEAFDEGEYCFPEDAIFPLMHALSEVARFRQEAGFDETEDD